MDPFEIINRVGKKINDCGMKYVNFIYSFVESKTTSKTTSINVQTDDRIWNQVTQTIISQPGAKITNVVELSSFDVISTDENFYQIERSLRIFDRCQKLNSSQSHFQKNQTFRCEGLMNDFLINVVNRTIN